jgi:hypothetical protein
MAEVTKELVFRTLIGLRNQIEDICQRMAEAKGQVRALELHALAMRVDLQNINVILQRHDARLERIEHRLMVAEVGL